MIVFPNAKINIGLRILGKRPDGFHELATAMVPVAWCDVLELVPAASGRSSLTLSGNALADACPPEKNLVMKALRAVEEAVGRELPTDIYLRKIIPDGAGLGGGSADAAFTVRALDELYGLALGQEQMAAIAASIGSDCPFFIYNRPMLVLGRGTDLSPVDICLDGVEAIVIAKPRTDAVSTREAYAGAAPAPLAPGEDLRLLLAEAPGRWADCGVKNDFEHSIFPLRPAIAALKDRIKAAGAVYTAMSGSGAAVFGLFDCKKSAEALVKALGDCQTFISDFPAAVR